MCACLHETREVLFAPAALYPYTFFLSHPVASEFVCDDDGTERTPGARRRRRKKKREDI